MKTAGRNDAGPNGIIVTFEAGSCLILQVPADMLQPKDHIRLKDQFREDIRNGLTANPKHIPSKYLYDQHGNRIFQQIMNMPEYYITDCEFEIFRNAESELLAHFRSGNRDFHLIDFGAGDGAKTKVLLDSFTRAGADFVYNPIDISGKIVEDLSSELRALYPDLEVDPVNREYFDALDEIGNQCCGRKVILFLGSNIGNFTFRESLTFFREISARLDPGDLLMTGFDLKKDPELILKAYNDPAGITREFNINLLKRINRELDAEFDPDGFFHYPVYDPEKGEARSYLVSKRKQAVRIGELSMTVAFGTWETIFTEVSRKYDLHQIRNLAENSGFTMVDNFYDSGRYFVDSLWKVA